MINFNNALYQRNLFNMSWSAILSGAVMAFGLTLLFNLLFLASGLFIFDETINDKAILFGFIIYLACGFILLYFSGIITGKIAHPKSKLSDGNSTIESQKSTPPFKNNKKLYCSGSIHGFLAWVIYFIINILFMSVIARTTPIESPFMYINEKTTAELKEELPQPTANPSFQDKDKNPKIENTENTIQDSAIIIFTILMTGAIAFTLGGASGIKLINKRPEWNLH
jgi:hypothetical protein